MPEKFAGISDTEVKYRQRYLDLLSSEESRAVFTVRSYAMRGIRDYMEREGFLEVETSTLNAISSGANAKPFTTHHNALDMDLFLRIAPELYLKRLLVGGMDKVFEIGRNYRNEGLSTRHNPEFTMMEFYEAYANFPKLIERTTHLLTHVDVYVENNLPKNILPIYLAWKENRTFTFSNPVKISMLQAVYNAAAKLGVNLHITNTGVFSEQMSHHVNRKIDMDVMWAELSNCKTMGQAICTLFEHMAEPFLTQDYRTSDNKYSVPVFITDYPKDICPLARSQDANPDFCDRFELYVDGRELCNAFQELNDPNEQELRFKEQLADNSKDAMDFDADYVTALQYGMPPAIGFGIGLDRLFMLLTNASSIRDVILFPTMKPV
jgi:lysyl-tRNA synthetase class 2